ncbi:MAG: hypothetical protein B6A08_20255 [Sorangiineae bacterium NIC37A_2]|nr:MAG: hypothetical protein B6A08_20255 [Sorangiineae bacterium NIC37A_2]
MAALNWLMGTADALGYVDPVSGTSLSSSTTAPSVITVVITKHAKPTTCGRDLEGFANQKRVLVGYNDASETTLTHELFHAMTDSSDHVSATRLGSLHDRMLMKAGAGTGKVIPGCNRWRATGGSPPAGCDAELEAQAFAADPNAFGCSMLRSRLGGVVDPPPAGPDIGAMEPPSPPSELVFTYGPDPGAPEVEFTDQTATNGEYSIVVPPGWTEITSPTVLTTSWANVGTEIAVDVYIPETVPNPWWVGAVAFAIDLPGAGFNNAWLGQVDLTPLPRGEWSTVSVQVGQALQEAILGDLPGMRIRIVTNVPDTFGFDPVLLDNLRFAGTLTPRTIFHQPGSNGTDVSTSAFLSFDVNGDWTSPQSALTQNLELVSDGTASLEVPAGGTKFIESRAFSTAELPQLGATLSVDVYVPDPQPNPWWVGAVQAYLSCPSANLHNAWLGQVPLSGLFPEEFNQLSFTLPASVPETLAGVASDCRFTLSLISNSGSGAFLFDRLGFLP